MVQRSGVPEQRRQAVAAPNEPQAESTAAPQAHLLQQLRPTDFRSFGAFLTWRQDMSQLLVSVLGLAARETSRANSRLAASCRSHMVLARSASALEQGCLPGEELTAVALRLLTRLSSDRQDHAPLGSSDVQSQHVCRRG